MKSFNRYACIALIFYGCSVTNKNAAPTLPLPDNYRNSVPAADTSNAANISWQVFFTDSLLKQLIGHALVKNYDMQVAVQNIEAARLVLKQSKSLYLPQADLQIAAGSNRPSDNSLNGLTATQYLGAKHIEDYNANVGVSWEADIWGRIRNQKNRALAQYLQTADAKAAVQTHLVASVARGYYNLQMLDDQLRIARKNLALNDSTIFLIRLEYQSGQATALAVQQAEAQRLVAARLIPQFEQQSLLQENALRILTGELPASVTRDSLPGNVRFDDSIAAGIPSALVANRPDVKNFEHSLDIAYADVGITRANMYPSLVITAEAGINSFKASNWFTIPASLFGAVAGSITQPLFAHRQLRTQYEIAKVEREKAVLQFRQSVLNAVGEVSDALATIGQLKAESIIVQERVQTLHLAIANAGLLFKSGLANYLEVITAQSNALQSELDFSVIRRQRLDAAVELYRALGGGRS